MAWTTPKTNWNSADRFYASDWKRIVGNLEVITTALSIAYTPKDTVSDGDVITSADRNVVTDLIETIYVAMSSTWNRDVVKPRVDYGSTWGSKELNIIESTIANFKAQLDGDITENCDRYTGSELICGDRLSVGLL